MTTQLPNITADENRILRTALAYTAQIAELQPQNWWTAYEREEYAADCAYGPLWSPSLWFRNVDSNAEVVRQTRVLRGLETKSLVITFRRPGRKCQHVRLTQAGEFLAQQLLAAEQAAQPKDPKE